MTIAVRRGMQIIVAGRYGRAIHSIGKTAGIDTILAIGDISTEECVVARTRAAGPVNCKYNTGLTFCDIRVDDTRTVDSLSPTSAKVGCISTKYDAVAVPLGAGALEPGIRYQAIRRFNFDKWRRASNAGPLYFSSFFEAQMNPISATAVRRMPQADRR